MAKKGGKKVIDFAGLSYREIGRILEKGARVKSFDGSDILDVLENERLRNEKRKNGEALEDDEIVLKFEKAIAPNSLFLNYMARLGFEFEKDNDGVIYTDELVYLSFKKSKKTKTEKLLNIEKGKVKDLKKFDENLKQLKNTNEMLDDIYLKIKANEKQKKRLEEKIKSLEVEIESTSDRHKKSALKKELKERNKELKDVNRKSVKLEEDRKRNVKTAKEVSKISNKKYGDKAKKDAEKSILNDIDKKQKELARVREKLGWKFLKDEDGRYIRNEEVEIGSENYTEDWFKYESKGVTLEDDTSSLSSKETREEVYKTIQLERKVVDGNKTITYKDTYKVINQSSAKSRVGKTLAVRCEIKAYDENDEELLGYKGTRKLDNEMVDELEDMVSFGLSRKFKGTDEKFDAVGLQAYAGLSQSAITDGYVDIDPKSILILKDVDVEIQCRASVGRKGYKEVDGKKLEDIILEHNDKYITKNTLFDGESLIDKSLLKGNKHSMVLLREGDMFKSACFKCDLQQYIRNQYKDLSDEEFAKVKVKDMFGNDIFLKDVKMITTNNSCKWIKFAKDKYPNSENYLREAYEDWVKRCVEKENLFAVVKKDKGTKYGELVRLSYQIENTIPFHTDIKVAKKEIEEILKDTIEYADSIKNDNVAFVDYLYSSNDEEMKIILDMLERNGDLIKSRFINDIRNEVSRNLINRAKEGKIYLVGGNETLCSNPIELIDLALGRLHLTENGKLDLSKFKSSFQKDGNVIDVYCKKFGDTEIVFARSPHSTTEGLCIGRNRSSNKQIDELFGDVSENIIFIDSTTFPSQDLLNGCDFDSDFVAASNNPKLVEIVKERSWNKGRVPVNAIGMSKKQYKIDEKALLDYNLSSNTIGQCSNLGVVAQSQLDELRRNKSKYIKELGKEVYESKVNGLEDVITKLCISSNISIDNAKRAYELDVPKFLNTIKREDCWLRDKNGKILYPYFFKDVSETPESKLALKKMSCNMDLASDVLSSKLKSDTKKTGLQNLDEFITDLDKTKVDYNFIDDFKKIVVKYDTEINSYYSRAKMFSEVDDMYDAIEISKKDMIIELRKLVSKYRKNDKLGFNDSTLKKLIELANSEEWSEIRKISMRALHKLDTKRFINSFAEGVKLIPSVNLKESAINSSESCLNNSVTVVSKINDLHDDLYKDVKKNIGAINDKYVGGEIKLGEAKKEINEMVDSVIKGLKIEVVDITKNHFKNAIEFGYCSTLYNTSINFGVGISFDLIPTRVLDGIMKKEFAGGLFSDRIYKNMDYTLKDNIKDILFKGIEEGKSVWTMSQEVKKMSEYSKKDCQRLVRTEVNHYFNQGTLEGYKELNISKYIFLATLDNRTSRVCASLDGKIFDVSKAQTGINYPPCHPYCRSTVISFVDEEFIKGLKRRAKDKNGKSILIDYMKYQEWYDKFMK